MSSIDIQPGKTPESDERDPENIEGLSFNGPLLIRSVSLSGIFFLMLMYTLYFAAALLIPITLAFLLSLVLTPVMRVLVAVHVPQVLAAILVVSTITLISMAALYALSSPATAWLDKAPQGIRKLETLLKVLEQPIEKIKQTQQKVEELTDMEKQAGRSEPNRGERFSLFKMVISGAPTALFGVSVTFVLLLYLLASGDAFLRKLVKVIPKLEDKKRAVETARDIQRQLSIYLGLISLINASLGAAVAIALYLLDVPNPILWGAMTAILNYVPYVGAVSSIVIVLIVSLLTFDSTQDILLPPLAVFGLTALEGQFLTPLIAGNRLAISPVAIFLTLVVMGWMWGIIGALLAVPLLASIKLICEHLTPFRPVAEFLGTSND